MLAVNVGNKFKGLAIHSLQVISGIKVEARLATLSYTSKEKATLFVYLLLWDGNPFPIVPVVYNIALLYLQ